MCVSNLTSECMAGGASKIASAPDALKESLAVSELRYRRLFETAKDGILILNAETGIVIDVNPFLTEMIGYSHEQFTGKAIWELGFLKDVIANREKFLELQQREYVRYENLPLETANGHRREVEFVSNVYQEGSLSVVQCNIRDITERKLAESQKRLNAQVLNVLNREGVFGQLAGEIIQLIKAHTGVEAIGLRLRDGVDFPYYKTDGFSTDFVAAERHLCALDGSGELVLDADGNPALECMCGDVLRGRFDPALPFFTSNGSFWTNSTTELLASTSEADRRGRTRNRCNSEGYESVALIPLRSGADVIGLLQLNDRRKGMFTPTHILFLEELGASIGIALERQQALIALKESTSFLTTLLEAIPAPVFYKDTEGRYIGFNKAFSAFYGKTRVDLIGKTVFDVASPELALVFRVKDTELFQHPGVQVFGTKMKDGQGVVHDVVYHKATFNNAAGQVVGLIGVILDTTDHVRLEEQFRQVQKMEAIGRLAGGVAHDFNNMLGIILGHTEMALDRMGPGQQVILEDLHSIQQAAERSAVLTRQLLAFARKQTIAPVVMDLNKAVGAMLKLLQRLIHEDINLVWLPGLELRPVKLDPSQVDQLLTNLCINARDAISCGGTILLETGNITLDATFCALHPEAVPGEYVFLAVHDDGAGMAPETLAHIFEPFFTTKGIGYGTGLGLATVYGIVKQNNGLIHASSRPGKGTTFLIYLPQAIAEMPAPSDKNISPLPRGSGETVLLVEDEKSLRNICNTFLDALGYNVLEAECPGDALEWSERHPGDIHLVLTDVVMPGMAATEMVRRIAATRPGIRVLFMSGYTADVIAQHGVLEKNVCFIAKPFTRDGFARNVRAALEGRPYEYTADLP